MKQPWLALALVVGAGSSAAAQCPEEPPVQAQVRAEPALSEPLATVYFAPGSANVGSRARDAIREAADWLAEHPRRLLMIEAHADASGSAAANLRVTQDRATAVRDALIEAGADPVRLVSSAHGETGAVFDDPTCNRRVVLRGTVQPFTELVEAQRGTSPPRDRAARTAPRQP